MGLEHDENGNQNGSEKRWDRDKMRLEYNRIGTQWDWSMMKMGPKWERETMGRGHNGTGTQSWYWNTMGLEHNETMAAN